MRFKRLCSLSVLAALVCSWFAPRLLADDELTAEMVVNSIERGRLYLASGQNTDGSWSVPELGQYKIGVSSLVLLALLNAGMTPADKPVAQALDYLRGLKEPEPKATYEVSLVLMALAAAKDGDRDKARMTHLVQKLEEMQISTGENRGGWNYGGRTAVAIGGDPSNSQFAVLALRDAAYAGIPVQRRTWELAQRYWLMHQNADGGWSYSLSAQPSGPSTGSMTCAGISSLVITGSMLRDDDDLKPDGTPNCCPEHKDDEPLERGIAWMARRFAVGSNPGRGHGGFLLYYLYGLERAGRLSGRRFFGQHDWYREGARFLVGGQSQRNGSWQALGSIESRPLIATSFALLFLSKGLSPVLINKLKYGPPDPRNELEVVGNNWNQHRNDIRNLTDLISGLPRWPRLVTWQVVDLPKALKFGGVEDLLQAPVLYLSGVDAIDLSADDVELLRAYVEQGGFLFAVNNCNGAGFDTGIRDLVRRMYPGDLANFKRLPAEHPIYRSQYLLDPDTTDLWGVDVGCRTTLVYSPDDLSCFWDKWSQLDPPNRTRETQSRIIKATRVGVNVIAYATGREPRNKLERNLLVNEEGRQDTIERGFLQVAKLRHGGGWDTAPRALRNLLLALNRTIGMVASTKQRNLPATDPNIFKYPVLYMHGRNHFQLGDQERRQVREYLDRGNVLFADACCGSQQFDESFRRFAAELYPDKKLQRIPVQHEMFSTQIGHDVRQVKRRVPQAGNAQEAFDTGIDVGEPFLEGIEIDGRYAVVYSKYDISCALEQQASVACAGYVPEDAFKIAVNVIRYALLQDVNYKDVVE